MPKTFKLCDGLASSVNEDIKNQIVKILFGFKSNNSNDVISQRKYQFIQDKQNTPGKSCLMTNTHPIQKGILNYLVGHNPEYTNKKFLYFTNMSGENLCFDIQDKGQKTSVQASKICAINFRVSQSWYKGTILCGNTMKDHTGNWMFLVEDIWMTEGENIVNKTLLQKFHILQKMMNSYVSDNEVQICKLVLAKIFPIRDLPRINQVQEPYPYNGYVFYSNTIGTRYIFNFEKKNIPETSVSKDNVFFQISLVDDCQLPDQYLMHCKNKDKLCFIGYAEVPDKDIRLSLVELLSNQKSVILPCQYINGWHFQKILLVFVEARL